MISPGARGEGRRGMGASMRCACVLVIIVLLGLATQAKSEETAVDEDPCVADMYAENCTDSCTMGTCNYHGRCQGRTGMCACFAGWSGADCNTPDGGDPCVKDTYAVGCTVECSMQDDCTNQGRCLGDGSCLCFSGWSGEDCNTTDGGLDPCVKDMYAEGCTAECSIEGPKP